MIDRIFDLVLDESKWLTIAMLLSIVAVAARAGARRRAASRRVRNLGAMNLFYGCMIGVMASGHLLAVTVKAVRGTLEGSPWLLYLLGVALAVPAWWLAARASRPPGGETPDGRTSAALNLWLAVCLLALGPYNLPLAAPAGLNLIYQRHSRPWVGWATLTVAVAGYLVLFVGSLIFFASGQSFEQFSGME